MDFSGRVPRLGAAPPRHRSASSSAGTAGKKPEASARTKPDSSQDDGPPRWKWWLHPETRKELRLTDKQSKKINEVWESTAPKLREKWHELENLEEALAKTIKENTADVAIVAQQVEKVEKLRADNNSTRTVMIYRMHLLLTARATRQSRRDSRPAWTRSASAGIRGAATSAESDLAHRDRRLTTFDPSHVSSGGSS